MITRSTTRLAAAIELYEEIVRLKRATDPPRPAAPPHSAIEFTAQRAWDAARRDLRICRRNVENGDGVAARFRTKKLAQPLNTARNCV